MMGWIRRASTTRLVLAAGAVLIIVVAGVVALSRRGDDVKPPPPASIGDLAALVGRRSPQGITADVTLTADAGHAASTTGSVWWKPGSLRIDLGSGDDAVRLVLVGDRVVISGNQRTLAATLPFGATLDPLLGELGQTWALEPPRSVIAGGRPAYEVRVVSRDPGSQVGGIAVAIGAASGLPVRLVITGADGRPAATLQLTDVHVGPVDDSVFASQSAGSEDVPAPERWGAAWAPCWSGGTPTSRSPSASGTAPRRCRSGRAPARRWSPLPAACCGSRAQATRTSSPGSPGPTAWPARPARRCNASPRGRHLSVSSP